MTGETKGAMGPNFFENVGSSEMSTFLLKTSGLFLLVKIKVLDFVGKYLNCSTGGTTPVVICNITFQIRAPCMIKHWT